MVKKGGLQNLQNLVEQTAIRSFNSLLKTYVTPYISFPKTTAHLEIARYLIEQGADPNARGSEGESIALPRRERRAARVGQRTGRSWHKCRLLQRRRDIGFDRS